MVSQVYKSAPLRCVAEFGYPVTCSGELSWAAAPHKDAAFHRTQPRRHP